MRFTSTSSRWIPDATDEDAKDVSFVTCTTTDVRGGEECGITDRRASSSAALRYCRQAQGPAWADDLRRNVLHMQPGSR